MTLRRTIAATAIALVTLGAGAANAKVYDFSYTFVNDSLASTPYSVTGSFTGATQIGDVVTGISGVTAVFHDGATATPLHNLAVYDYVPTSPDCGDASCFILNGPAQASFDPGKNNFFFSDGPPGSETNWFYIIQPWGNPGLGSTSIAVQYVSPTLSVEPYNGDYVGADWHLTAVPEPATWAMLLLGFGVLGWTLRGARRHGAVAA